MADFESSAGPQEYSSAVYEVVFTPILERYTAEPIHSKLLALKERMDPEDFENYINSLLTIKYNGRDLWLITRSERNRTLIEGRFLPLIAEVFGVGSPRVIAQP